MRNENSRSKSMRQLKKNPPPSSDKNTTTSSTYSYFASIMPSWSPLSSSMSEQHSVNVLNSSTSLGCGMVQDDNNVVLEKQSRLTAPGYRYPRPQTPRSVAPMQCHQEGKQSPSDEIDTEQEELKTPPESLEGTLYFRKGKSAGGTRSSRAWKQRYVILHLSAADGGSISCYTLPRRIVFGGETTGSRFVTGSSNREGGELCLKIPSTVDWVAKDIENDASGFVIEIPSEALLVVSSTPASRDTLEEFADEELDPSIDTLTGSRTTSDSIPTNRISASTTTTTSTLDSIDEDMQKELERAREQGKPLRYYFRSKRVGNEKVLWLSVLNRLGRFSNELRTRKGVMAAFASPNLQLSHSRIRSERCENCAREERQAFVGHDRKPSIPADDPDTMLRQRHKGKKEYKVIPRYAYPNRWMTHYELHQQMLKESEVFHDLRISNAKQKEIGILKVEILQCLGLPPLDFATDTDAVVYLCVGSYAFSTDVIWNRLNPMWLPKSRRACIFPLYHGYARLFVGVFDDDGKKEKDDFAGRVVIDLARCRPKSRYDVTMPLRESTHVYSRRPRGAIRLRFSVEWHSEKEALLSYIPRQMIHPPSLKRPDNDVTVLCGDEKAFRNIATTVHGIHMPGRFSFQEWKATIREFDFARKIVINTLRDLAFGLVKWENPALSLFVFLAWMHSVYAGAFSLVPAYAGTFLLLMMARNYMIYGTDGRIQDGFIPPSFEEMLLALVRSGKTSVIAPLEMTPQRTHTSSSRSLPVDEYEARAITHKPQGKRLFRLLGFKSVDEGTPPEQYQMEFPFSQGLYPKFTAQESLFHKSTLVGLKKKDYETAEEEEVPDTTSPKRALSFDLDILPKSRKDRRQDGTDNDDEENNFYAPRIMMESTLDGLGHGIGLDGAVKLLQHKMHPDSERSLSIEEIPPFKRIPEQNIDVEDEKTKKKLSDEMYEIRDTMHKMTFHLFNDRTHVVRNRDACYFGQANKDKWRRGDVNQELDRLLNVGQYSSANPVVARVGLYVEPIINAARSGLCFSRAVYNIITWRDPMLSFWVSILLAAIVVILFIFPWKLFFFLTGLVVVGPQNFVLRKLEERGRTPQFIKKLLKRTPKDKRESDGSSKVIPTDQPIISCHSPDGAAPLGLTHEDVDSRQIHEVSVPYSQLMYQRMYDWPPEAQYARVERNDLRERFSPTASGGQHGSFSSKT